MKVVVFGNKGRGISCLKALMEHPKINVALVVAHPDRVVTCSKNQSFSDFVKSEKIPLLQPEDANDCSVVQEIREHSPDLIILCGYGQILKPVIFQMPKIACINCHSGKLPDFRGASPVNWALIEGENEIGLSIIEVDAGIDTGPIVAERTIPVEENDNAGSLQDKADTHFAQMLVNVVNDYLSDSVDHTLQKKLSGSYYPLRSPEDGLILWESMSAKEIICLITALSSPYPSAFSFYKGVKVSILKAELVEPRMKGIPGKVYRASNKRIVVMCSDRCIKITDYAFEGDSSAAIPFERGTYFKTLRSIVLGLEKYF